jgi:hypothetical protein
MAISSYSKDQRPIEQTQCTIFQIKFQINWPQKHSEVSNNCITGTSIPFFIVSVFQYMIRHFGTQKYSESSNWSLYHIQKQVSIYHI